MSEDNSNAKKAAENLLSTLPSEAEIKKLKRGELNQLANKLGLDPDEYKRADDLRSQVFKQIESEHSKEPKEEEDRGKTSEEKKPAKPEKTKPKPARPRVERRSRRYQSAHGLVDKTKAYPVAKAVELVLKTSTVKFDAAVEIHINLGVDPKHADQLVRGTTILPHGSGKQQRVAALVPESELDTIKKAGADVVGHQDLLEKISKNDLEFDILVAHPDVMKDLTKHAKTLGPLGLMPNPKAGTVTTNVAKTVKELKAGRIEFRVDRYGIIHQTVGRVSTEPKKIEENIRALVSAITQAKPASTKGTYLQKTTLTTSMGPSIRLDLSSN